MNTSNVQKVSNISPMHSTEVHNVSEITPATHAVETTLSAMTAAVTAMSADVDTTNKPLRDCVMSAVKNYFSHLGNAKPSNVYEMVLAQIEPAILSTTMRFTRGNQSKAAKVLGLSRGTLRKKLKTYDRE